MGLTQNRCRSIGIKLIIYIFKVKSSPPSTIFPSQCSPPPLIHPTAKIRFYTDRINYFYIVHKSEVLYLDLSPKSMAIAQLRAEYRSLKNIRYYKNGLKRTEFTIYTWGDWEFSLDHPFRNEFISWIFFHILKIAWFW